MRNQAVFWGFLVAFIASISVVNAQESPLTVSGATTVDAKMAKELHDRGATFIDVRTPELWETGHIPGAHFLELFEVFDKSSLLKVAGKNDEIVIYCAGPSCKRSSKGCAKAVSWGFTKVYYFRGGYPEWIAAGYPSDPP